jgi:FHS family Na+ dependent glucose MFS transporter 1
MWQRQASSPIHALHFGYGMGALIAPQLARPFVSIEPIDHGHKQFVATNLSTAIIDGTYASDNMPNFTSSSADSSDIKVPYLIGAAIALVFSAVFCMFHVFEKCIDTRKTFSGISHVASREQTKTEKQRVRKLLRILNPGTCTGGDSMFGAVFFFGAFFLFFNTVGGEHGYTKFLYTYAREGPLHMDNDTAAMVNTLFWLCFMGGRGIAILVSKWLHPRTMLITQLTFVLVSGIALSVWGASVPQVLWVFTGLLAAFLGPVLPAGISWCNHYVLMRGTAVAIVFLATGMGSMFYQWLTGYLFQYRGAHSVMYVILGFSIFLCLNFAFLLIIVRRRPERFQREVMVTTVNTNGDASATDVVLPLNETKQSIT